MKTVPLYALACVAFLSWRDARAADESGDYRELIAQVVDQFRQPVPGIEVQLHGLDRGSINARYLFSSADSDGAEKAKYRGWKFKTDAQGKCAVRFGKFDFWEHEKATGISSPGYGEYFLIVGSDGYAGGVSPQILNLNEEDLKNYKAPELNDLSPTEWDAWKFGEYETRVLTDDPEGSQPVEIVLRRGIEVSGKLLDVNSRPIRGQTVNLWNDLHADTHTGRGGEIFGRVDETDAAGNFHFHHVFPNLFYVSLQGQEGDRLFWIKTQVRKRWIDGIADVIWPHTDDVDLPLVIVAARQSPHRYFGKVTDEKGRPIRGAKVEIQAGIHGPNGRSDFDDDHGHCNRAVTRGDGSYDLAAGGSYVNWFEITAAGFQTRQYSEDGRINGWDRYEEAPCAPGRYDFELKRK